MTPTSDRDEPALLPVLVAAMWPTIVTCTLLVPYLDVLDFAVFFCACEVLVAFCIFQRAPVLSCTCSFSSLSFFSRRDSPQPALFCASFCRFLFSAGSDAHSFEKSKPEVFWTQCPLQRRFLAVFSGLVFVGTHRLHIFIFTFRMRLTVSSAAVMYWGFFFLSLFSSS